MVDQDGLCTECGASVSSTDKFCAGCGHNLGDDTPSPSSSQSQTEVDSDASVEEPEYEKQKDLALLNVRREVDDIRRLVAYMKDRDVIEEALFQQLNTQVAVLLDYTIWVAMPFCEADWDALMELQDMVLDKLEHEVDAMFADYRQTDPEPERRYRAERNFWRINQAAQDQKSSAEQEQRANAARDRINQTAQERKSSADYERRANAERDRINQATQDEANPAFFAEKEKEQKQQARGEQKTPSLGEQIEGRWKQIEGSAAYKQVATAALWIGLVIVFLLVVAECGEPSNPYDCRPPMKFLNGECYTPG